MNIADELQKLQQLYQSGAINEDEYNRAKARILDEKPSAGAPFLGNLFAGDLESQTRQWGLFLHLSVLLSFVGVGIIVPILIWQLKKNDLPGLDVHGKNAVNWIISALIYGLVCVILHFVLIGYILFPILLVLTTIFAIMAGIKAYNGEAWKYPGAIEFFK
jgi:uncharacterized protein